MEKKSYFLAEKYRNIGNNHFSKNEYFDALIFYNRSLCCAENGSEAMSMAFSNRSAVYLKLNHFDLCLENIKLARDNNYPQDKMKKLDKREQDCKELMKTLKPSPYDNPFNYFKLSYPPNPKYPQIIDCLELRKDIEGVHEVVVATRDLKTGDVIAIEDPVFPSIFHGARLHRCNFCIKDQLMNLFPCSGCAVAMFCSEKCREEAMNGFHQYECNKDLITDFMIFYSEHLMVHYFRLFKNNVADLRKFLEANTKPVTVFDFDFSNPEDPMYEKNMLLVAMSKVLGSKYRFEIKKSLASNGISEFAHCNKKFNQLYQKDPSLLNMIQTFFDVRLDFILSTLHSKEINLEKHFSQEAESSGGKGMKEATVGTATFPLRKLLNPSCDPNIKILDVAGKSVLFVCKPIKKDGQLFVTGLNFYEYGLGRRQLIENLFSFKCDCEACIENWPTISKLPVVDPLYRDDAVQFLSPHDEAKKNIARNNAYIDKNYREHKPTQEVCTSIYNNFYEHHALARPSFYP